MDLPKVRGAAEKIAKETGADVLLYSGDIVPTCGNRFIDTLTSRRRADNLLLVLVTAGGDPDEAYKIGRAAQSLYKRVSVFVPGWCKSAGTLLAVAGHELIIADKGELGPVDIQIAKSDEIMEYASGLTLDAAMKSLETTAGKMFVNLLVSIQRDSGGRITTKTAADHASRIVTALLDPIFAQIDPIRIGENSRAMQITKGYGVRLNNNSRNLKENAIDFLVSAYPDHRFVIDRTEAKSLFNSVSEPSASLTTLTDAMEEDAVLPARPARDGLPQIEYLSSEITKAASTQDHEPKPSSPVRLRTARNPPRPRTNGRSAPNPGAGA